MSAGKVDELLSYVSRSDRTTGPMFRALLGSSKDILEGLQAMKMQSNVLVDFAARCAEVVIEIGERMTGRWEDMSSEVNVRIELIQDLLANIAALYNQASRVARRSTSSAAVNLKSEIPRFEALLKSLREDLNAVLRNEEGAVKDKVWLSRKSHVPYDRELEEYCATMEPLDSDPPNTSNKQVIPRYVPRTLKNHERTPISIPRELSYEEADELSLASSKIESPPSPDFDHNPFPGFSFNTSEVSLVTSRSASSRLLPRVAWQRDLDLEDILSNDGLEMPTHPLEDSQVRRYVRQLISLCQGGVTSNVKSYLKHLSDEDRSTLISMLLSMNLEHPSESLSLTEFSHEEVTILLDIAQYVADSGGVPDREETRGNAGPSLTSFLYKVAKSTGMTPPSLNLDGITHDGRYPLLGGGCADIWQGCYQGEVVALKVLRTFGEQPRALDELKLEAILWRQLHHPNVLPLFGLCLDVFTPRVALVSPWLPFGHLRAFLQSSDGVGCDRLDMSLQISRGLNYLHARLPSIIHGDIRPANILVDEFKRPRITDFGLARLLEGTNNTDSNSHRGTCPLKWLAPELLNPRRFGSTTSRCTKQSDVYSLAMTLYEVISDTPPFNGLPESTVTIQVGVHDDRPIRLVLFSDDVWEFLKGCWEVEATHRPEIRNVVTTLERIVSKIKKSTIH